MLLTNVFHLLLFHIYQYDLSSAVQATIQASKTNKANTGIKKNCLQIGPDKNIYVSLGGANGASYLGIINDPDSLICNYFFF